MKLNVAALVFAFAAACGTDTSDPPITGDCTPGETMACECSPTSMGTMTCGADSTFGVCGQCSIPDPDPLKVNFQAQIVPIINKSCGTGVTGCHGRDAYGASLTQDCRGWLTMENVPLGAKFYSGPRNGQTTGCPDLPLYERLTQIDVWQCLTTSVAYVTPGDVSKSYIMNKLNGVNMCKESSTSPSDQMPPPQPPENPNPFVISAPDKALIQKWIEEGALNN
jgi:hypothetical protein